MKGNYITLAINMLAVTIYLLCTGVETAMVLTALLPANSKFELLTASCY